MPTIHDLDTLLATLIAWSGIQEQYEKYGSATEGAGWAALFLDVTAEDWREAGLHKAQDEGTKSYILYCDTQGVYSYDSFDTVDEAKEHWTRVQLELEPEKWELFGLFTRLR